MSIMAMLGALAFGQTPTVKSAANSRVPRGADGKPDLTGVWQGGTTVRGSWEQANAGTGLGGTGLNPNAPVLPASSDRQTREGAPYQTWAAKKVLESFKQRAIDDPTARCLPAGVPRSVILGLFPQQYIHTPKQLVILYEYMGASRIIPFTSKHDPDVEPTYMGDSIARWEGDTLVIDITNFNDKTWLIGAGTFHSDQMHIVEKYTRVDQDQINYEATIEDPKVLSKPWVVRNTIMLREGTRIHEYICAENNLDVGRYEQLLKDGVKINRQ